MNLANEEIQELLTRMAKQCDGIRLELLRMSWYMRGGLNYSEAMLLSHKERELISELIKENLDTTKKTKMPFF